MSGTVWLLACGYPPDAWGYHWRTRRLARRLETVPGLRDVIWCRSPGRLNVLVFATEAHAWKAQEELQYREVLRIGRMVWKVRTGWGVGRNVFRGEMDKEKWELRIMEPAKGWDAIPESSRPIGAPWPPPENVTDVVHFVTEKGQLKGERDDA